MGMVKVKGSIGGSNKRLQELEFLVDTGSFYTMLTPRLSRDLGITTTVGSRVVVADSRTNEIEVGVAYLKLLDREGGIPVGIVEVPMPLLGASALEVLGLKVDPITETLEHSRPFGPAAL